MKLYYVVDERMVLMSRNSSIRIHMSGRQETIILDFCSHFLEIPRRLHMSDIELSITYHRNRACLLFLESWTFSINECPHKATIYLTFQEFHDCKKRVPRPLDELPRRLAPHVSCSLLFVTISDRDAQVNYLGFPIFRKALFLSR